MLKYIIKRVLISILILFGVSLIIYFFMRMLPMDYIDAKFAAQVSQGVISPEDILRIKELYGLADNSFWGIIKGYFKWLVNLVQGDLGMSFKYNMPVSEVIVKNMWISFSISFVALIFQFLISIPLGIKSAVKQYSAWDYTVTILAMIGISLPSYFLAALLMRVLSVQLGWFPLQGLVDANKMFNNPFEQFLDMLHHLVLPMLVYVVLSIGGLMRYTRTNTLEVLNADYIRTARAKGLSENSVIYKHALRNTMIPIVTMMAGILPGLFGGAMIIEQVFAIPGIGQKAYMALTEGDIPFVMGYNMFIAVLTVIGILLSDLMYMLVDPRVRIDK